MEELTILARSDFIDHIWFEIDVERTWDVFPRCRFGKKGAKTISTVPSYGIAALKTAIRLSDRFNVKRVSYILFDTECRTHAQPVLGGVQLPCRMRRVNRANECVSPQQLTTSIPDLHSCLTDVHRDDLAHLIDRKRNLKEVTRIS
jgi:hypothetical protein